MVKIRISTFDQFQDVYMVEQVCNAKLIDEKVYYAIKWKGYKVRNWVHENDVMAVRLVNSFWRSKFYARKDERLFYEEVKSKITNKEVLLANARKRPILSEDDEEDDFEEEDNEQGIEVDLIEVPSEKIIKFVDAGLCNFDVFHQAIVEGYEEPIWVKPIGEISKPTLVAFWEDKLKNGEPKYKHMLRHLDIFPKNTIRKHVSHYIFFKRYASDVKRYGDYPPPPKRKRMDIQENKNKDNAVLPIDEFPISNETSEGSLGNAEMSGLLGSSEVNVSDANAPIKLEMDSRPQVEKIVEEKSTVGCSKSEIGVEPLSAVLSIADSDDDLETTVTVSKEIEQSDLIGSDFENKIEVSRSLSPELCPSGEVSELVPVESEINANSVQAESEIEDICCDDSVDSLETTTTTAEHIKDEENIITDESQLKITAVIMPMQNELNDDKTPKPSAVADMIDIEIYDIMEDLLTSICELNKPINIFNESEIIVSRDVDDEQVEQIESFEPSQHICFNTYSTNYMDNLHTMLSGEDEIIEENEHMLQLNNLEPFVDAEQTFLQEEIMNTVNPHQQSAQYEHFGVDDENDVLNSVKTADVSEMFQLDKFSPNDYNEGELHHDDTSGSEEVESTFLSEEVYAVDRSHLLTQDEDLEEAETLLQTYRTTGVDETVVLNDLQNRDVCEEHAIYHETTATEDVNDIHLFENDFTPENSQLPEQDEDIEEAELLPQTVRTTGVDETVVLNDLQNRDVCVEHAIYHKITATKDVKDINLLENDLITENSDLLKQSEDQEGTDAFLQTVRITGVDETVLLNELQSGDDCEEHAICHEITASEEVNDIHLFENAFTPENSQLPEQDEDHEDDEALLQTVRTTDVDETVLLNELQSGDDCEEHAICHELTASEDVNDTNLSEKIRNIENPQLLEQADHHEKADALLQTIETPDVRRMFSSEELQIVKKKANERVVLSSLLQKLLQEEAVNMKKSFMSQVLQNCISLTQIREFYFHILSHSFDQFASSARLILHWLEIGRSDCFEGTFLSNETVDNLGCGKLETIYGDEYSFRLEKYGETIDSAIVDCLQRDFINLVETSEEIRIINENIEYFLHSKGEPSTIMVVDSEAAILRAEQKRISELSQVVAAEEQEDIIVTEPQMHARPDIEITETDLLNQLRNKTVPMNSEIIRENAQTIPVQNKYMDIEADDYYNPSKLTGSKFDFSKLSFQENLGLMTLVIIPYSYTPFEPYFFISVYFAIYKILEKIGTTITVPCFEEFLKLFCYVRMTMGDKACLSCPQDIHNSLPGKLFEILSYGSKTRSDIVSPDEKLQTESSDTSVPRAQKSIVSPREEVNYPRPSSDHSLSRLLTADAVPKPQEAAVISSPSFGDSSVTHRSSLSFPFQSASKSIRLDEFCFNDDKLTLPTNTDRRPAINPTLFQPIHTTAVPSLPQPVQNFTNSNPLFNFAAESSITQSTLNTDINNSNIGTSSTNPNLNTQFNLGTLPTSNSWIFPEIMNPLKANSMPLVLPTSLSNATFQPSLGVNLQTHIPTEELTRQCLQNSFGGIQTATPVSHTSASQILNQHMLSSFLQGGGNFWNGPQTSNDRRYSDQS